MTAATLRMANIVAALLFLLGAGAAQAADVLFEDTDPNKATSILNLEVNGTAYNVVSFELTEAFNVYGSLPGDFAITDEDTAVDAVSAMTSALTDEGATSAGEIGFDCPGISPDCNQTIYLCYATSGSGLPALCHAARTAFDDVEGWGATDLDQSLYNADTRNYALLEVVPEPGATLLIVTALSTLGVVARWRREEGKGTA